MVNNTDSSNSIEENQGDTEVPRLPRLTTITEQTQEDVRLEEIDILLHEVVRLIEEIDILPHEVGRLLEEITSMINSFDSPSSGESKNDKN